MHLGTDVDRCAKVAARLARSELQFKNHYFTEMCSGSKEGSYLRLIDFLSLNSKLESNKEEARRRSLRQGRHTHGEGFVRV